MTINVLKREGLWSVIVDIIDDSEQCQVELFNRLNEKDLGLYLCRVGPCWF